MAFQYDSRKLTAGDIFLCLPGGESYVEDARRRGAIEIRRVTRAEMACLASEVYGHPSKTLTVLGVTGTNGKTTTVTLLGQILFKAGFKPVVSGTLTGNLTTPESLDLQQQMAVALTQGATHFVMEVSSHGIAQERVAAIQFAGKGLTNMTQDHLDFHQTIEAYRATKLGFMREYPGWSVLPEDYRSITLPSGFPLLGDFNRQNAQLAKAMALRTGLKASVIDAALKDAQAPKGRFEPVDTQGLGFTVVVDYAHAPDGIQQVLQTARQVMVEQKMNGRLWIMFGCGGDRDRSKRPIMGGLAAQLADCVVVTSDNPRTEDPDTIIQEILVGIPENRRAKGDDRGSKVEVIVDRREAICFVVNRAQVGDFVVVAGKGHEDYQIVGAQKIHFDDCEEVKKALQERVKRNLPL